MSHYLLIATFEMNLVNSKLQKNGCERLQILMAAAFEAFYSATMPPLLNAAREATLMI